MGVLRPGQNPRPLTGMFYIPRARAISDSSTAYTSLVSCSAMQFTVTLTTEAEAAFGGAFAFLALQVVAAAAVGAAVGADMAWMARWTVNDFPVPGRPLM